jgi:hypothetical protein
MANPARRFSHNGQQLAHVYFEVSRAVHPEEF